MEGPLTLVPQRPEKAHQDACVNGDLFFDTTSERTTIRRCCGLDTPAFDRFLFTGITYPPRFQPETIITYELRRYI